MQKTVHVCDLCKKTEIDEKNGCVVHGNLYVFPHGGVIGNNFPQHSDGDGPSGPSFTAAEVGRTEVCNPCLAKHLGLQLTSPCFNFGDR